MIFGKVKRKYNVLVYVETMTYVFLCNECMWLNTVTHYGCRLYPVCNFIKGLKVFCGIDDMTSASVWASPFYTIIKFCSLNLSGIFTMLLFSAYLVVSSILSLTWDQMFEVFITCFMSLYEPVVKCATHKLVWEIVNGYFSNFLCILLTLQFQSFFLFMLNHCVMVRLVSL